MNTLLKDIRYGIRHLLKRPGFALMVLLVLGLGIGSTTAIFSIVDALLLRSLPYPNSERLVSLSEVSDKGSLMGVAEPNFEDVLSRSKSFEALGISIGSFPLLVTGASEAVSTRVSYTSFRFFDVLGARPLIGRSFVAEEDKFGGPVAVLVSYGYWKKLLGGRDNLSSVRLNVDGVVCSVVGVMPAGFDYPARTEIWISRNTEPANTSRTAHNWRGVGRLRAGTTLAQANAEVSMIGRQLRETYGEKTDTVDFKLIPLQSFLTRNVRQGLWLLFGAVGLLLLVACANFSNLLLTQLNARQREFTVRCALGASGARLVRQLLTENLLLTLPAAALGALLATFGIRLLLTLDKGALPQLNKISVDGRVLLFASGLGVAIAVVLSFLPALRTAKQELSTALKAAGRRESPAGLGQRVRGAMVVGQIALTLVLLAGAGLLGRSFLNVMKIDPGFKPERAVVMTLTLPTTITLEEDEQLRQFYVQLLERAGQLPGVTEIGGINVLPLEGGGGGTFLIDDDPAQPGYALYRVASSGYFAAMKIPLLRGRAFGREDTVNSPHVAVISQSLAQRYWPNEDPLGKRIQFGNMDKDKHLLNVVGIVGDVRATLEREAQPTVYAFSLQRPQWWQVVGLHIVVRAQAEPEALIPALRSTVQGLRSDAPATFATLEQVFSSAFDARRFTLVLFGVFAGVALLITVIGLFGMLACSVGERRQEIGIRMAMGAQARHVLQLVIGQGLKLAAVGIAIGLAAAWALTRLMRTLLFGVSPTDAQTYLGIGFLLLLVSLLACWVPARRATKVDPLVALREE